LALALLCALIFLSVGPLRAQEMVVRFDPATTRIDFTLGATLHTVHGMFRLKSGEIRFDPATGAAGGAVIVDAASGDTANSSRDKKMHSEILESAKFPEIVFTPTRVSGSINDLLAWKKTAFQVSGLFRLHGQDHDAMLALAAEPLSTPGADSTDRLQVTANFPVPYIQWGLKNPSTFLLRVADTVDVAIAATVRIARSARAGP
jgi:polyisoprenoid-binding protein YceI